jgi:phosphoribosylformimino-5-aminoimidazole carboxamide ribotide isomerase
LFRPEHVSDRSNQVAALNASGASGQTTVFDRHHAGGHGNSVDMFRPCIDLHEGRVKQIVGGTLSDDAARLRTNFVSSRSSAYYADLYQRDGLTGGHVILLGPGNEAAATEALRAFPGGMHLGGGVNIDNACQWLDLGASHVIVTSWVFRDGVLDHERLNTLVQTVGQKRLVLDLSCRRRDDEYFVVTDRWQKFTSLKVDAATLEGLAQHCDEFLIHAADVEGLCQGIDEELVERLGAASPIPTTYAGGAKSLADLETVERLGKGRIDLTIGSALDIFGGSGVRYEDCVAFNRERTR